MQHKEPSTGSLKWTTLKLMTPSPPLMLMWEGRNNMKIIRSEFQATRFPQSQKGICYLLLASEYSVSGIRHEVFTVIPWFRLWISHNMSSQRSTMEMKRLWRSGTGLDLLLDLKSWAGKELPVLIPLVKIWVCEGRKELFQYTYSFWVRCAAVYFSAKRLWI